MPSSPHKASMVSLDSQSPVGRPFVAYVLYRSELQVWSKMCVSSGEVFSGLSIPQQARVVSLDTQNPVGGPFDILARNCRVYHVHK